MTIFPILQRDSNGYFGPTKNCHYYQPITYHSSTSSHNPHKSQWRIREYEQYGVFKLADENSWYCSKNDGYFSIVDKGNYLLGTQNEVLAHFPNPINENDTWHGFPVFSSSKTPSEALLEKWEHKSVIDFILRRRIAKGQI